MNFNRRFSSPNHSERAGNIEFVIIHFTEISFQDTIMRLCDPQAKVSAHYVIKADGEIFNLVDDARTAWHAGVSFWSNKNKLNEYSIGIELDNDGKSDFPQQQMDSCIYLCQHIKTIYNIKKQNFIGHSDVAPNRKIDPGILFDWSSFAKFDIGLWYNENTIELNQPQILLKDGAANDKVLKLQSNLSKIGYKIELTGIFDLQTNYVVRAFQAHFNPKLLQKLGMDFYWSDDSKYFWNKSSELILNNLILELQNLKGD